MSFKEIQPKKAMTKSDLKTGMCVEMRCGWRAFILLDTTKGNIHVSPKHWKSEQRSWGQNNIWKEDLTADPTAFASIHLRMEDFHYYSQYDIVKIWDIKPELNWALEEPNDWQLIFERG